MHTDSSASRPPSPLEEANQRFHDSADRALRELFARARTKDELQFAMSLSVEFRGVQDPGWNTAVDAHVAFEQYLTFLSDGVSTPLKARVALAFYAHLAEASGFYEIPKNMLRVAGGQRYSWCPFQELVEAHGKAGQVIAPNANKVLRDLAGHAQVLGLTELAEIFRDAFDSDLRNGYAHADYVIWNDGIRLPKRNGGNPRKVSWPEFNARLERGVNLFNLLSGIVHDSMALFHPAKVVRGRTGDEREGVWRICADPERRTFTISGGWPAQGHDAAATEHGP